MRRTGGVTISKPTPPTLHCVCGESFVGNVKLARHRRTCQVLDETIYDEVARIADELGRAPTEDDYKRMARKDLPSFSWITSRVAAWTEILAEIGVLDEPHPRCDNTPCGRSYIPLHDPAMDDRGYAVSSYYTNDRGETVCVLR